MVKMSELVRRGSKGMNQVRSEMFQTLGGQVVGCCGVGAAVIGIFEHPELARELWQENSTENLFTDTPLECNIQCQMCIGKKPMFTSLVGALYHLNDVHKLTFEQLAVELEKVGR